MEYTNKERRKKKEESKLKFYDNFNTTLWQRNVDPYKKKKIQESKMDFLKTTVIRGEHEKISSSKKYRPKVRKNLRKYNTKSGNQQTPRK